MVTFEIRNKDTREECLVKLVNGEKILVPKSEDNSDYQEYLKYLELSPAAQ